MSWSRVPFSFGRLPAHINHTPDPKSADSGKSCRLQAFNICLLNVSLKIITRVLVNGLRPRPVMDSLIAPTHLPGRGTTDNNFYLNSGKEFLCKRWGILSSLTKDAKVNCYYYLKKSQVDLSKAFDRLKLRGKPPKRTCSIEALLFRTRHLESNKAKSLPENWLSLIMHIVSSSSFQILWNYTSQLETPLATATSSFRRLFLSFSFLRLRKCNWLDYRGEEMQFHLILSKLLLVSL